MDEEAPPKPPTQPTPQPKSSSDMTPKSVEIHAVVENGIKFNTAENGIHLTNNQIAPVDNC